MNKRMVRFRFVAASLAIIMTIVISACSSSNSNNSGNSNGATTPDGSSTPKAPKDAVTLQVFSMPSNTSGLQQGWWANILEEKVGVKLELQAAGDQGEQKLQALMAGGELPDIVVFKTSKQVSDAVRANMLINLDEHKDKLPNVFRNADKALQYYRDTASNGTGNAYSVTNAIGKAEIQGETSYGPYLRWDLYKKLGMPEINTLEDYLPLLKQMQELEPKTKDGQRVYAFSLWKDWDGSRMQQAQMTSVMNGIDTGDQLGGLPFLQVDVNSGETKSILDSDSEYVRALKFYYQANQMGLVDPDSLTQRFDTANQKMQQGRVLFGFWSWVTGGYDTPERTNADSFTGFRPVLIKDYKAFWASDNPIGNSWSFAISSSTKHLDAALKYLDFMYSTDGLQLLLNGPKGVTWDMNEKGEPYVTDQGWDIIDNQKELPGGGKISDGTAIVNSYGLSTATINPTTNAALSSAYWPSSQGRNPTKLMKDWQDTVGFKTTTEMLKANNTYTLAPLAVKLIPSLSDEMNVTVTKIGEVVKTNSWKAVFAKNDAEFDSYIAEMQKKADGLGIQELLDWANNAWKTAQEDAVKYKE